MRASNLYIGLMSGTSMDGIDVALVDFSNHGCKLLSSLLHPIDGEIKKMLGSLSAPKSNSNQHRIELMAKLDVIMGQFFADSVNELLKQNNLTKEQITATGCHGQTIRHRPDYDHPFTLQIGDPNIIAEKTGISVVADFRRADIAAGGQGAPLAPAFHNAVLRSENEDRVILNLGGIANITFLPKDKNIPVIGFDTGPANTLLDAWYIKHHRKPRLESCSDFDQNSLFAQQGAIHQPLLEQLLKDPYLQLEPPKSTGREYFSLDWLEEHINSLSETITRQDVQRTLVEFTATSIATSIKKLAFEDIKIYACGGGMHNHFLLDLLSEKLLSKVQTTNELGVDGDYLEAMTFAWLAKQRIENLPGNLPSVTGANKLKVLGSVYL